MVSGTSRAFSFSSAMLPMQSFGSHMLAAFTMAAEEATKTCNLDGVSFVVVDSASLSGIIDGWDPTDLPRFTVVCKVGPVSEDTEG